MENKLIVISGASGVGKTTLVNAAVQQIEGLQIVTAVTTRPPRPFEQNSLAGKKSITNQQFTTLLNQNKLCCVNKVYNAYYAFLKGDIDEALSGGKVILEYAVSLLAEIKSIYADCFCIYVYSDNSKMLKDSLKNRNNPQIRYQSDLFDLQALRNKNDMIDVFFHNDFTEKSIRRFNEMICSL